MSEATTFWGFLGACLLYFVFCGIGLFVIDLLLGWIT